MPKYNEPQQNRRTAGSLALAILVGAMGCADEVAVSEDAALRTTLEPPASFKRDTAVQRNYASFGGTTASLLIYKDYPAWFGENRDELVLSSPPFNLVDGVDYRVLPTAELMNGIPAGTTTVLITSNSMGDIFTAFNVNHPASQAALDAFTQSGGQLIVHLGDISPASLGFLVPGLVGAGTRVQDGNLNAIEVVPGTRFARGPDRAAGTEDDATEDNIQILASQCCGFHGSLDGVLPADATVFLTSAAGKPIYAEYPHGLGRIVVGTLTFEFGVEGFFGQRDRMLINHFFNALNPVPDRDRDGSPEDEDCDDTNAHVGRLLYEDTLSEDSGFFAEPPQLSEEPWMYDDGALVATGSGQQARIGQAQSWGDIAVFATLSSRGTLGGCCDNEGPINRWRAGLVVRGELDEDQDEGFHGYRCALASNASTVDGVPHSGPSTGFFLQVAEFMDGAEDEISTECEDGVNTTFDELDREEHSIVDLASGETAELAFYAVGDTLHCQVSANGQTVTATGHDDSFRTGTIGFSTLNMFGEFHSVRVCEARATP